MKVFRTVILPGLFGFKNWSFTLRVLENRMLRRIFEHKRNEVTWEWRKLHIVELNDL